MFIKVIDYLSPSITFYHNRKLSHSSILSGILSFITTIIIIILAIYYSMALIFHKNPEAFYFVRFVEDAGIYPFNSSSLFHFISIINHNPFATGLKEELDFTKFRVVGIEKNFESYLFTKDIKNMNHWLYGKCDNDSDIKGIEHIIDQDFFVHSACIRKFYNFTEKKYYNTDDPNFYWPVLAHGTFSSKQLLYNIIIDKCQDDSLKEIGGEELICDSDAQIAEYFKNTLSINFNFIDEYIDMLNYKEPNKKFLFRIQNKLTQDSYFMNHLNFNPTQIKTQDGYFVDNIKEHMSIVYERNDASVYANDRSDIYTVYRFWLNNREQHYERSYKKVQDVISAMGGTAHIIYIFAKLLNYIYNYYIIISDTQSLLLSIQSDKNMHKKEIFKTNNNNINASYIQLLNNSEIPNPQTNITIYKNKKISVSSNNKTKIRNGRNSGENNIINNEENTKHIIIDDKKEEINFLHFLIYKIFCGKKESNIKIFEDFRAKIISEEEIFKTFFYIHNTVHNTIKINKDIDKKNNI